ncbi:MAG: pyridoxamine 5'-phosphate oxidase family protein [Chitinophagales bacterium]
MGDKKDLNGQEAILKMRELAEEIKVCMFCTYKDNELQARPMTAQQVDEFGNIWFLSDKNSAKNANIAVNSHVDLLFGQGTAKFLSLHGSATILYDKEKIKELWQPIAKIWFTEGVDDPRISVIKLSVEHGYYWDTKHGKAIETAIMVAAFLSGKTMDDGIEGNLRIRG